MQKKKSFFSRIDTPVFLSFWGPSVGPSYGEYDLVLIVEEKRTPVFLLQLAPWSGSINLRILRHFWQKCSPRDPDIQGISRCGNKGILEAKFRIGFPFCKNGNKPANLVPKWPNNLEPWDTWKSDEIERNQKTLKEIKRH